MNIAQAFKTSRNFLPRLILVLSVGFLALSSILLILGNQLLEENTSHILEQRLVIAQLVANHIDRSLVVAISELEQTLRLADFDPSDPNLEDEAQAMAKESSHPELLISEITFIDPAGRVVLAQPPDRYTPGTDLSGRSDIAQALEEREVHISTPYHEPASESLMTAITIPIYDEENFQGWLRGVVGLDEPEIKKLLEEAVALDNTAHGVLVDSQGRSLISTFDLPFLSPGEHHSYYRRAIAQGQPVVEEVPFELDFLPGEPPGHHHIMAFAPLKIVSWGVSVGGDVVEETFAGSYRLYIGLASVFALSTIVIWGITLISTRRLLKPVRNVHQKFDLGRQIASATEWEELTSLAVSIPSTLAPVSRAHLLLRDQDSNFELAAEWDSERKSPRLLIHSQRVETCDTCPLVKNATVHSLVPCSRQSEVLPSNNHDGYCLPLIHKDHLIGTLQFWLPSSESLSENQREIFTSVASDIAAAIESAQLRRSSLAQVEITQADQRRIYRRLHDTLGQNISFLRLKLDQHSSVENPASLSDIQKDIERMRDIANEAYDQIRGELADLHPETQSDLGVALRTRAGSVAERANFEYEITVEGQPVKIPRHIKRHVLFICYEALNNIEQHAHAQKVSMHLLWGKDDLTITITDDGSGFDLDNPPSEGHFGLDIMHERAQAIRGKLTLISAPKGGTEVALQFPLLRQHETGDDDLK